MSIEAAVCRCYFKNNFPKILQYSHERTCVGVLFNNVPGPQACNLIKKDSNTNAFIVNIAKPFYTEHLRWLLL